MMAREQQGDRVLWLGTKTGAVRHIADQSHTGRLRATCHRGAGSLLVLSDEEIDARSVCGACVRSAVSDVMVEARRATAEGAWS